MENEKRRKLTKGEIVYHIIKWTVYLLWVAHIVLAIFFILYDFFMWILWAIWCVTAAAWGYFTIIAAETLLVPMEKIDRGK